MFENQLTARAYPKQPVSVLFRPVQHEVEFRFESDVAGIFILGLITGAALFSRN